MPIYEYYCPDNHTIYQFYAKTLAQGATVPPCPDNPRFAMQKMISSFAVQRRGGGVPDAGEGPSGGESADDSRMEAAMSAMEREFGQVDENDPKAMGRMMRRMAELTGEKLDGQMEEVVRRLEEGADPDSIEEQLAGADEGEMPGGEGGPGESGDEPREARHRFRVRRRVPRRDPRLYDYP